VVDAGANPSPVLDALPLRPDDLLAFRLGRLLLLMETVPTLPAQKPMDIERISFYDFFADNPFLIFGRDTPEHKELVLAGFDSRNLSYQSSAQRFSSRRERLQHDLAMLVAHGLAGAGQESRRVVYSLTTRGTDVASSPRSLYAIAYRSSATVVGRTLNRLSDKALQERTRSWLRADELLIDLFEAANANTGGAL
jgi:ABC-3C biological conflict system middle component